MCEPSLLCRLTCARFVASSTKALATDLGGGVMAMYHFEPGSTTITITVSPVHPPTLTLSRVLTHGDILSGVHPRGVDGGVIFTAALARSAIAFLCSAKVLRPTPPGVAPCLPPTVSTMVLASAAAAFCRLNLLTLSTDGSIATLTHGVTIRFSLCGAQIWISDSNRSTTWRRRTPLCANMDEYLSRLCFTLSGMLLRFLNF